jgi:metal-responsive CopG/Arc/MetJ family transcriptional regulator
MAKTISIRIDESLLKAVDAAVKPEQRRRSEVIREALELWLRRRALEEKVRRHGDGYARHPVTPDEFQPILKSQRWPK